MGEDAGTGGAAVSATEDAGAPMSATEDTQQIEQEIERTREELGDTVEALAHKTDVKAQAKEKIEETKATVTEKAEHLIGQAKSASPDSAATAATQASQKASENPLPVAAAGAFVVGFLVGRITKH